MFYWIRKIFLSIVFISLLVTLIYSVQSYLQPHVVTKDVVALTNVNYVQTNNIVHKKKKYYFTYLDETGFTKCYVPVNTNIHKGDRVRLYANEKSMSYNSEYDDHGWYYLKSSVVFNELLTIIWSGISLLVTAAFLVRFRR